MWRELAESLGWPGFPLGWLDVGSLAQDPSAYQYYSGGEYGDELRLSHPHPGLSGAGAGTLLALVQAAQAKTTAVSAEDIQTPIVQASVGAFESAVSSFANSTTSLSGNMRERGAIVWAPASCMKMMSFMATAAPLCLFIRWKARL
ncbi:MAG: hypothetical protein M5U34_46080 [Chloroflexi bacterium]|nr:hypothetical protein [Chloroflexota bacterium]